MRLDVSQVRPAAVADRFYPGAAGPLARMVDSLFLTTVHRVVGGNPFTSLCEGGLLAPAADFRLRWLYHDLGGPGGCTQAFARYDRLASNPGALSRYDLVIFNGGRIQWLPPIPSIAFGTVIGRDEPRTEIDQTTRIASWRRSHPLLRQVSLDGLLIAQHRPLALQDDPTGAVTGNELASGPDGPLIMEVNDRGVRRVVVAFELSQSNWPTQPGFVIFMVNAIERLTRLIGQATAATFTTTTPITVRADPAASKVVATGPVTLERPVPAGGDAVELGVVPRAGVYRLTGVDAGDQLIPVNLASPNESAIATFDALDLAGGPTAASGVGAAAPREIWRWFALAGLALLTIEWLLYAWRMRV